MTEDKTSHFNHRQIMAHFALNVAISAATLDDRPRQQFLNRLQAATGVLPEALSQSEHFAEIFEFLAPHLTLNPDDQKRLQEFQEKVAAVATAVAVAGMQGAVSE